MQRTGDRSIHSPSPMISGSWTRRQWLTGGAFAAGGLLAWLNGASLRAQSSRYPNEEQETIRRTLTFAGSGEHTLELDNVSGFVHVTAGSGRNVEMIANRMIRAESAERMADAKREVQLDITENAETLRIYVDGPFRCNCSDGTDGWRSNGGRRWDGDRYDVNIDFDLQVPPNIRLRLRTVNKGDVTMTGTSGDFEVANVNGSITLTDVRGSGSARTVNGPVHASFLESPKGPSSFKTVNGVIEVQFPENFSADLQLKTFNGGLYTDFDVKAMPSPAPVAERVNGKLVYRNNGYTAVRVGNGGPEIKFDGFNGDVRILRRTR